LHEISSLDLRVLSELIVPEGDLTLEPGEFTPHPVHKVPTYFFRMVHATSGAPMGTINLRIGNNAHLQLYAGHVGYFVDVAHQGNRYASYPAQRSSSEMPLPSGAVNA
jgi:hypothetical protein